MTLREFVQLHSMLEDRHGPDFPVFFLTEKPRLSGAFHWFPTSGLTIASDQGLNVVRTAPDLVRMFRCRDSPGRQGF